MPAAATTPFPMNTPLEKRRGYMSRLTRLKADRSSWDDHWYDLGRHILPRVPRFFASDRNRAGKGKYNAIYNNTATRSARVLAAGISTGMTSPARPWFRLTTRDEELRDDQVIREWLDIVTERMQMVFTKSNVYRRLPKMYKELGVFGTSASLVLSDFDSVIRMYPLNIGEYCLAQDYQSRIVTVYREFERTVSEVVKEFGFENCSIGVQQSFTDRNLDVGVKLLHVVEPRADQERRPNSPLAIDMPWRSIYMEQTSEATKILREGGFRRLRLVAPRWDVEGNDVYGISAAMEALGDIRGLQQRELRLAQAIDYKTLPPLQVPTGMKGRSLQEQRPGGQSYFEPGTIMPFDQVGPQGGIRSAFEVTLEIPPILLDIEQTEQRIKKALYEDLFLMLATRGADGRMTATEVLERQEEKLLMIGPVLERMSNELLEPLIDITFQEMLEKGVVPPPPDELAGRELEVEFISILAQAQQAVGISGVQQFMSDILAVAEARPDVADNVNFDEWARTVGELRGVNADLLVDPADVDALREARANAEAAREQVAMAQQQASTVKDLSAAPVDQNTALDAALDSLTGQVAEA